MFESHYLRVPGIHLEVPRSETEFRVKIVLLNIPEIISLRLNFPGVSLVDLQIKV